jgi:hypothetical protein
MTWEVLQDVKSNVYTRLFYLPRECEDVADLLYDSFFLSVSLYFWIQKQYICNRSYRVYQLFYPHTSTDKNKVDIRDEMKPRTKRKYRPQLSSNGILYTYNMLYRDFPSPITKSSTPLATFHSLTLSACYCISFVILVQNIM